MKKNTCETSLNLDIKLYYYYIYVRKKKHTTQKKIQLQTKMWMQMGKFSFVWNNWLLQG